MTNRRSLASRPALALVRLGLTGSLLGGLLAVAGCHWLWMHDEESLAVCDEVYADCMASAWSEDDEAWCVAEVESCYEACEAGWDEGSSVADEADAGEADDAEGTSAAESSEGTTGADPGEGDTDELPQVCLDLHANCIEQAQTLADVEACEALFDQCIDPGECPSCGCPEGALEGCLANYAACAEAAASEPEVDACAAEFDACTAPFADLCEVAENPNLDACLAQHELCVACAEGDEQIAACQTVFDSCLIQL